MKPHAFAAATNTTRRTPLFQQTILLGLLVQVVLFAAASWYCFPMTSHRPPSDDRMERFFNRQQQQLQAPPWQYPISRSIYATASNHTTTTTIMSSPLLGLMRSYPNSPHHDPTQRRHCLAFTAVPKELDKLFAAIHDVLQNARLADILDCIHVTIPDRSIRYSTTDLSAYPTTRQLQEKCHDPRIIITRTSFDYGPMTRYLGPLYFEQHPQTTMILFDVDTDLRHLLYRPQHDLGLLFLAASRIDTQAMWCWQGENFVVDNDNVVHPAWDTFALEQVTTFHNATTTTSSNVLAYNECHFCRGVGGLAFKPLHFGNFWWNQTDYHESCFWDDDRWVSYQMERQGFPLKVLHYNETAMNNKNGGWLDLASHGMMRHPVPAEIRAHEIPVETPEERRRKELDAERLEKRKEGNFRQRLRLRQQQEQLKERQRLRREHEAAEEQKKHDAVLAGAEPHEAANDDDAKQESNERHDKAAPFGGNPPVDGDESHDVNDNADAFDKNVKKAEVMMHRRLGSLTQITNSLISDQTCPLAWLSRHPEAYPSARINRNDPSIPPPPVDLAQIKANLLKHRAAPHRAVAIAVSGTKHVTALGMEKHIPSPVVLVHHDAAKGLPADAGDEN